MGKAEMSSIIISLLPNFYSLKSTVSPKKPAVDYRTPSPRLRRKCRSVDSRGMTLLELLIVITLIGVLAALLLPAFSKVKNAAREKQFDIEKGVIGSAIAMYRTREAGALPAESGIYGEPALADVVEDTDWDYKGENHIVMGELKGADPAVLDEKKLRFDESGNVLDPWGNQYTIKINADTFDGTTFYTEFVYSGMP